MTALGTASIKSYADYEQLAGGVETLYGATISSVEEYVEKTGASLLVAEKQFERYQNREKEVLEDAANAYKFAGMSANEYMETVNGFAASLTNSLGEYEGSAGTYAKNIVTDMADNANKMGTSMESIQNAYSGFAKGNFTMLDNLKLGYGGTKEEMERLLQRAAELEGVEAFDINNFADITDAIHIIQEEMGITGTTAKEASLTISGSANAMSAAWSNLLTGLADENADIDSLIDNLVDSVAIFGENIMPRVEQVIQGIGELIERLLPVIVDRIPGIVSGILPDLVNAGVDMIVSLVDGMQENLPVLMSAGGDILSTLIDGIVTVLPSLATMAYKLIEQFAVWLTSRETLRNIINAGIELIIWLANALLDAIPKLIDAVPVIITNLVIAVIDNLPLLLEAAIGILGAIAKFLVENVPKLLDSVPIIFEHLVNAFFEMDWAQIGSNIIDGIWNGISAGWNWLVSKVKQVAGSLFGAAQEELDIHSPSGKFKWLGEMCVAGFEEGTEDLMDPQEMTRNIDASISTARMNMSSGYAQSGKDQYQIENKVHVHLEGDAKGVFKLVRNENNNIIRSTGVNPLLDC